MIQSTKRFSKTFLTALGLTSLTFSYWCLDANAISLEIETNNFLIAQKLGEIERQVELSEVPTTVLSSARAVSGGEPTKAQVQINPNGTLVYELGGQNQQGFDFEIEVNPNGEIIEIDEQIESSAVPEEVMKAFEYWLPNAQLVETWRSTRYETFDYYYEIVIDDNFWVEIPADGSTLKINPLSTLHGGEN